MPGISLALLLAGIALDYYKVGFFSGYVRLAWYGLAFVLVGWKVVKAAVLSIPSGNIFNEFLLMSLATLGRLCHRRVPRGRGRDAVLHRGRAVSGRGREPGQAQHPGPARNSGHRSDGGARRPNRWCSTPKPCR